MALHCQLQFGLVEYFCRVRVCVSPWLGCVCSFAMLHSV